MSSTGLKRKKNDKFYTNPGVVEKCINAIKEHLHTNNPIIIEPSAGNGAFIQHIKSLTETFAFYDIEPEHDEIIGANFLDLDLCVFNQDKPIWFIGNPPFGRQSSLAIRFIKKCSEVADFICFILPSSFKKDSMQKHFPTNFHLISEHDIADNGFSIEEKPYDVPCVFQIWQKCKLPRKMPPKLFANGFSFVKKNQQPDIAFRRVGVYAGNIYPDTEDKSEQSHYFIRFDRPCKVSDLISKLKDISYPSNNTVGPKSISKQELIYQFNKLI